MATGEIIALLLSSAVISGIVTTVLSYIFDIVKNKNDRSFRLRQEAYTKVISCISGMSNKIFNHFTNYLEGGVIERKVVIQFITTYNRDLAPIMLVTNNAIKDRLKKIPELISRGAKALESAHNSVEKINGGFIVKEESQGGRDLKKWKDEIEELEENIIQLMRKDLGIHD